MTLQETGGPEQGFVLEGRCLQVQTNRQALFVAASRQGQGWQAGEVGAKEEKKGTHRERR